MVPTPPAKEENVTTTAPQTKAPRKPVKATITRTLKAAGFAQSVEGGFFTPTTDGFRQNATHFPGLSSAGNGSVIVISWHYKDQTLDAFRRVLMGSEGLNQSIKAPQGHDDVVKGAVKALTSAGFHATVEPGRDGAEVWVQSAEVVEHRTRLANRTAHAEEIAAALLPDGDTFRVVATEYPTHRSGESVLTRADMLSKLAVLVGAGFMEDPGKTPLTLNRFQGTGVFSPRHEIIITTV